jgi:chemotaxis protein CheZ
MPTSKHPKQSELSIFETTARLLEAPALVSGTAPESIPVIAAIRDLLRGLGSGKSELIEGSLVRLGAKNETELFDVIGHMARRLHDSLNEFKHSLDRDNVTICTTTIPDAADKLEAVIKMTFDAAQKTLTLTEEQADLLAAQKEQLQAFEILVSRAELSKVARAEFQQFLTQQRANLERSNLINSEVLMAQAFQDLTGQALKKVIRLVTELETNLVSLIQLFGEQTADGAPQPEAEQTQAGLKQNDVDSILSSFGF